MHGTAKTSLRRKISEEFATERSSRIGESLRSIKELNSEGGFRVLR